MGAEALKLVLREYTMCRYVERHLALYERLARQGPLGTPMHTRRLAGQFKRDPGV
jgi:hypothetical protein